MNEFFKKMLERVKTLWGKWTLVQKLIFAGIAAALLVAVVMLITFSSSTDMVSLLSSPINDPEQLDRISIRLNEDGIIHKLSETSILVDSEKVARRARSILFRENLIPREISPWDVFNTGNKWTKTELETNVRIQQSITKTIENHIKSLNEIDDVQVVLTFPENKILASEQREPKASIIISPRPGVKIHEHNRIEGIENLVLFAVDGLTKENLIITDNNGKLLNSNDEYIEGQENLLLAKQELKIKHELQNQYTMKIQQALERVFADRVAIANVEIGLNFDTEDYIRTKLLPSIMKKDNPLTPRDETLYVEAIATEIEEKYLESETTGIHPEGPPGAEGQVSDGYKDVTGAINWQDLDHVIKRRLVSKITTNGKKSAVHLESIAIGIMLDGKWTVKRNKKGSEVISESGGIDREFTPVTKEEEKDVEKIIKAAINFSVNDGDRVVVTSMKFDRSSEFEAEDAAFRRKKVVAMGAILTFLIIALILVFAFITRAIIRAREKIKRRKEEELARKQAALREAALRRAEEDSVNMQMSVGGKNVEDEEMAKQLTRENPEDVAHLIRTWLVEE